MLAARAVQGVGAAVMMALSIAIARDAVPAASTGRAMGFLGTVSAIGTTLGPSVGGLCIAAGTWRSIFLVNIPIGLVAFALAYRWLPLDAPTPAGDRARFDWAGTAAMVLTLAAYALAATVGRGHFGPLNLALLVASACGTGVFMFVEAHASSPMITLHLLVNRCVRAALVTSLIVSTVMMTTLVVGPFYLSRALGLDAAAVGFVLSAGPFVAALSGFPAGHIVDRLGAPRLVRIGLVGIAGGVSLLAIVPSRLGVIGYVLPMAVTTASYAMFQAANNTALMSAVAPADRGVAGGMVNLSRNLGLITGASVMGAVFAHAVGPIELTAAAPSAVAAAMRVTFAVAAMLVAAALAIGARPSTLRRRPAPVQLRERGAFTFADTSNSGSRAPRRSHRIP